MPSLHLNRAAPLSQYRLHYQPRADRLPRWLHRVWAWF